MQGVIIIDDEQLIINNAVNVTITQSDKQFAIRVETADAEALLDTLINDEVEPEKPVAGVEQAVVQSSQVDQPNEPQVPKVRVVVEETGKTDTPPVFLKPGVQKTSNQPSNFGILKSGAIVPGGRLALGDDDMQLLRETRRALGVATIGDNQANTFKNLTKNKILKSNVFTTLVDGMVKRTAIQALVMQEQDACNGISRQPVAGRANEQVVGRENFLYSEVQLQLVILEIEDEQAGVGKFYYEEMVSIYENPQHIKSEQKG